MGTVRLLLALSVVIAHSAPLFGLTLVGGKLAVQAFFIVSGFYMSLILNEKYPATRDGNWLFYSNRFLRIFPMYWAVLIIAPLGVAAFYVAGQIAPWLFPSRFDQIVVSGATQDLAKLSADQLAFVVASNVGLFGMDWAYFMRFDLAHLAFTQNWFAHSPTPNLLYVVPQAWTLGIEVMVYALAPLIFRRSTLLLAALFLLPLAARTLAYDYGLNHDPWTDRFFFFEIGLFALGGLLYRAYRSSFFSTGAGLSALVACVSTILLYQFAPELPGATVGFTNRELLFLVPFAACVPLVFAVSKNWRVDRWLGELSYPLYLSHLIVIGAFRGDFGPYNIGAVFASLGLAAGLALAIDLPVERWRQARVKQSVVPKAELHDLVGTSA